MTTSKKYTQTVTLGVDPGYGRLGYAVFKQADNDGELLDYSCLETSSKEPHTKRLLKLAKEIEEIILRYKPNVLAIEKLYFNKNQKTALAVAEVKGIILYLALKNNLKIAEYTPLEVKVAVCGYGRASKEQVGKMVNLLTKIPKNLKSDDVSDAIALCLTYASRRNVIHKFYPDNV